MTTAIAGLVVALPEEARSLMTRAPKPGECVPLGESGLLCVCGIGPERARRAAGLLAARGARGLVSWGCAAGLVPGLRAGDLCLPGMVLDARGESFAVTPAWHARARAVLIARGLTVRTEPLVAVEQLIASAEGKSALGGAHGAIAADMESAAVGAAAREHRLPFLAVRAVADPADVPLPRAVMGATDGAGAVRAVRLVRHALAHPRDLAGLLRLARCFRAALRTLSAVARLIGDGFVLDAEASAPGQAAPSARTRGV